VTVTIAQDFFQATMQLSADEQHRVLDFLGRFTQAGPASAGRSTERVKGARSQDVWSTRVSDDLRAILVKEDSIWHLVHVDRHDAAYRWAARTRVERHQATGALQILQSTVKEEIVVQKKVQLQEPGLLDHHTDDYLISLGLPPDWLSALRMVTHEDQLLEMISGLPEDVGERLFLVAAGQIVAPPAPAPAGGTSLDSPDTRRRFYVVENEEDLRAALAAPLARWIAFLHPTQRNVAEGRFSGPVKVTGSAGTGKTVAAMHRARHLSRQGRKILLTTFVNTLAENLKRNLQLFCTSEEMERITVSTVHSEALRLVQQVDRKTRAATRDYVKERIEANAGLAAGAFDVAFLLAEWEGVIGLHGITSWEEYLRVRRTGRGRPLSAKERKSVWSVMERVHAELARDHRLDFQSLCRQARTLLEEGRVRSPYDSVVVDEVQDLSVQEIRMLAALAGEGPDRLLVAGDAGQRIHPGGFSLKALGVNTVGRSFVLRLNYRTTEQIRRFADQLLGEVDDELEEGTDARSGTRSLLKGPAPHLQGFSTIEAQVRWVTERVAQELQGGLSPEDIAIFARQVKTLEGFRDALDVRSIPTTSLQLNREASGIRLGSMHRAKGLEFKSVFAVEVSEAELPSPAVLDACGDPADREQTLANEKRLLYVALTRARDEVFVTWTGAPSLFLSEAGLLPSGDAAGK